MNVASLLTRSAASHGPRIAVRQGPSHLTYTELSEQASRFGSGLWALGLARGARVALSMKNRPEYAVAMFGAFRAALVAVPINARLHPSELDYILQHCGAQPLLRSADGSDARSPLSRPPKLTIVAGGAPEAGISFEDVLAAGDPAARDEEVDADDLAWLFYTSGTTGRPKGAELSHRNLVRAAVSCLADVLARDEHELEAVD